MEYDFIRRSTAKEQVSLESQQGKRPRLIELVNTNRPLLSEFDKVMVSKTGLTTPAGWCVAMAVENAKDAFVIIVLGAQTRDVRIATVKNIRYNHMNAATAIEPWKVGF